MGNTGRAFLGALSGLVGGLAMTLMVQKVAPRVIPEEMRPEEFVPKKVVEWAEEKMGNPATLAEDQEMRVAMGAHLGYSAMMGSIYGLARPYLKALPAPVSGAAFGIAVWGLSFEGLLPVFGVMERTTSKPAKKWPMPIMGHVIYGAATGLTFELFESLQGQARKKHWSASTPFDSSGQQIPRGESQERASGAQSAKASQPL